MYKPTWVTQAVHNNLVKSHWRLDDFDLVTTFGDKLRHEKHVSEQKTVDVRLRRILR